MPQNIGDFNVAAGKLRLMGAYGGQACGDWGQDFGLEAPGTLNPKP